MLKRLDQARQAVIWGLWLVLLASIPITSFPLVAGILGKNPVSPLALIPLVLLAFLWFLPYMKRRGPLPVTSGPLLFFVLVCVASAVLALGLPIYPFKSETILSREVRGLLTLGIGIGFYWTAACLPATNRQMTLSLRALYLGAALTLLWSTIQIGLALDNVKAVPWRLNAIHRLLSIRDLPTDRVTGLAYEPSWLGDQLVLLYIPFWLASLRRRVSVFPWPRRWPLIEAALLCWSTGVLLLSQSRISQLGFLAMIGALVAAWSWRLAGRLSARFAPRRSATLSGRSPLRLGLWLASLITVVGLVTAGAWALGSYDWRIRRVFTFPVHLEEIRQLHPGEVGYAVADRLAFAERVVYWAVGYRVFEHYPLFGVGPGNTGFFFEDHLPPYGLRLEEIQLVLTAREYGFPNTKNLWIRLLAETGMIGFTSFLAWVVCFVAGAASLARNRKRLPKMLGLAGLLAAIALVGEGFSLDSFALPQLWISFGLVTAGFMHREIIDDADSGALQGAPQSTIPGGGLKMQEDQPNGSNP
jgi:hypothetical protein